MNFSPQKSEAREETLRLGRESWWLLFTTYAMIAAGALALAVAEGWSGYFLLALVLCATHALVTGPNGKAVFFPDMAQNLGVLALLLCLLHSYLSEINLTYSLGHFLIFVQLILLYGEHRLRYLRLIEVSAIFQLLIAGIWAREPVYLACFLLAGISWMTHLAVLELHRAQWLSSAGQLAARSRGRAGLRTFLVAIWPPAIVVLACTVAGFFLLPRNLWLAADNLPLGGAVTGYSEKTSLWQIGRLRQSKRVALRARFLELTRQGSKPYRPNSILMRGTSLADYSNGRWSNPDDFSLYQPPAPRRGIGVVSQFRSRDIYLLKNTGVEKRRIRQNVELAGLPRDTLFALYRPIYLEGAETHRLHVDPLSDRLLPTDSIRQAGSYTVVSELPRFGAERLRKAGTPGPPRPGAVFWHISDSLRPIVERTAARITEIYKPETDYDRVLAVQSYLLERFQYTLDLPEFNADNPMAAFLTETHRGCCEHFASALALICRVWSIPTRVVVGFKNGSLDKDSGYYTFRDEDAHAWVEVFFNGLGWAPFDPTPPSEIALIPSTGPVKKALQGPAKLFSGITHTLRRVWRSKIMGYDRSQQKRLLARLSDLFNGLALDASAGLRSLAPGMPDLGLWEVLIILIVLTTFGLGLHMLARTLELRFLRQRREKTVDFYEDLLKILRRKGIVRRPSSAPRQLARRAADRLGETNDNPRALQSALNTITDLYCRSRFGSHTLTDEERETTKRALRTIREALPSGR